MKAELALVFPGQGSQSVGMFAEMAERFPVVAQVFDQASAALGYDLWDLCSNGPEQRLNQTENTQPALLTAGYAAWCAWRERGGAAPRLMAGHSLGEYTALTCAGALDFADAVRLAADRGRIMQTAAPAGAGAMAALVGLDDETVMQVCAEAAQGQTVTAANFNCPGQVVIAGDAAAVERAMELARKAGAKRTAALAVSAPSHCPLMRAAATELRRRIDETPIAAPEIPVMQNVDAQVRNNPEDIKEALVEQLYRPVLWSRSIAAMRRDHGIAKIVECGPGRVLRGLIRRTEKDIACAGVSDPASLDEALELGAQNV